MLLLKVRLFDSPKKTGCTHNMETAPIEFIDTHFHLWDVHNEEAGHTAAMLGEFVTAYPTYTMEVWLQSRNFARSIFFCSFLFTVFVDRITGLTRFPGSRWRPQSTWKPFLNADFQKPSGCMQHRRPSPEATRSLPLPLFPMFHHFHWFHNADLPFFFALCR